MKKLNKTSKNKSTSHFSSIDSKNKVGGALWWAFLVLFVAACSGLFMVQWSESPAPARHNKVAWWYNASDKSHDRHMTKWLAEQAVPVVLYDTPFDHWKSTKWSPKRLAKDSKIAQVLSKKGDHNVFHYFANDQPLASIAQLKESKPYIEVIYPRERFFTLLDEPFDGHYYYSSGGVEILGIDPLYSPNQLEQLTFWMSDDQDLGQVNFWFGMENVTAYTHYDTSYNLHSISYGQKKFVLFPPDAYSELKLYPCLHQFYRQTHTPVTDVLSPEMIRKLNGIEIVLRPGEVLNIPPYWFHCVVTMETTLSVNVWSQSKVYLTMEEVYSSPLPFEESWGRETLMEALSHFWRVTSSDLFNLKFVVLLKKIVYERYEPLLSKFTPNERARLQSQVKRFCKEQNFELSHKLSHEALEHIMKHAENIKSLFRTISPVAVREINFGNYVEHTALRVLGHDDIILFPFYLQACVGFSV